MPDPPADPERGDAGAVRRDRGSATGTPRWVKVFGLVALVVVVLFIVLAVIGGGEHGPGRHTGSDAPSAHTRPPSGFEHGARQQ